MRAIPSVVTVAAAAAVLVLLPIWWSEGSYAALSLATGYVGAGLLLATLLVTPIYRLTRRRASPLHLPLRRSLGVNAAVVAGVHLVVSFPVHLGGDVRAYFLEPTGGPLLSRFGLSNWLGLGALAVLAVLAATSTDGAIRRLGARTWRRVHRLAYVAALLTVAHTLLYQSIRSSNALLVAAVVGASSGLVVVRLLSRRALDISATNVDDPGASQPRR